MVDPPRSPAAGDGPGAKPDHGSPSGGPPKTPRWVKVSAIIAGVVIVVVVIAMLTGLGGSHGPGRHSGAGRAAMVSSVDLLVCPGGDQQERRAEQSSHR